MRLSLSALVLVLARCLVVPGVSSAQPAALDFERLSIDEGLTDYVVMALERDATGFLWVGTQGGLNRYDGARVRPFIRAPEGAGSLSDHYIRALEEDPTEPGTLWIGTNTGGLSRFDSGTERFTTFKAEGSDSSSISSNAIRALYADSRNVLWVGTDDAGLNRYRPEEQGFDVFRHVAGEPNSLVNDTVRVLYEPPSMPGILWIGTKSGLSVFDTEHVRFTNYGSHPQDPTTLSHNTVTAIAEVGGFVWCGTEDGVLHRFDPSTQRFERFDSILGERIVGLISVLAASRTYPNLLWIGLRGQGVLALDVETFKVVQFTRVAGEPASLSRADVLSLIEDDAGLLWVGTTAGLNKASLQGKRFAPYVNDPKTPNTLSVPTVLTLYEAPSEPGVVWIGTERGGLNRFDQSTGTYTYYFTAPDHPLNLVLAIYEDSFSNLWLGTNRRDLFLFDRVTGEVEAYPLAAEADRPLINQIYEAPSEPGILWVATRGLGLVKFDIQNWSVRRQYTDDPEDTVRLSSSHVWFVYERPEEQGVLWLATHGGGLNRLETQTDSVLVIHDRERDVPCFPSGRIVSIASGKRDLLWLGTFDDGLVRFDIRTGTCKTYTTADGLPHMRIGSILKDERGRLWLSTNNGLSLFNTDTETFTNFTEADGLQSNIFHFKASYQNADGEIFVGGANGFNIFHPDSIVIRETPPPVVITEMIVDGEPYPFKPQLAQGEDIRLNYSKNDVEFKFAALDLTHPSANRYRVKLEPVDDEWDLLEEGASERYPQLGPGDYLFKVQGSNSDGVWNEAGSSIRFIITPPFWQSWWFWTLIAGLAFGLVVGAFQYRIYHLKREERTRQRIADDLHDDIGSKMSSIALDLEMAGRLLALDGEKRDRLDAVAETARAVVDDLRDTVWIVDAEHDNLGDLITRMKQVTGALLQGCRYRFYKPKPTPDVPLKMEQRRHLFLFFKEALHNVVRHAEAAYVEVRVAYEAGRLTIEVQDDGLGFDTETVGRGRGLTTMRKRVEEELGGTLMIESAPGQGATVRLTVKIA